MVRRILTLILSFVFICGCATTGMDRQGQGKQTSATATGAVLGAVAGGIAGAVTGPKHANKGKRVLIGAAAGALIGGTIGYILDQQAKQLESGLGVKSVDNTNPEAEGKTGYAKEKPVSIVKDPDRLRLIFKDTVLFDKGSYELKSKEPVRKIAEAVKNKDVSSVVIVAGFTDNTGDFDYNISLSEKRANVVRRELVLHGLSPSNVLAFGCGPKKPIAPNDTEEGRALNRRVEVYIYPEGVRIPHPCE